MKPVLAGKESNKHASKKLHVGGGTSGKATVMGAKERGGKIAARPLGWEPGETLAGFVHENVEAGETVYTDDHRAYRSLKEVYEHETVRHSVSEYVNGPGPYKRDRIVLGALEARVSRYVPQDEPESTCTATLPSSPPAITSVASTHWSRWKSWPGAWKEDVSNITNSQRNGIRATC